MTTHPVPPEKPPRRATRLRGLVQGMSGRRTNVALLLLVAAATVTGGLSFAVGTAWVRWLNAVHGAVGLGMVLVVHWKWRMVRRGLQARPAGSTWPSVVLGVLVVTALVTGVLHSTGLVRGAGPVRGMHLHVAAALLAIPLVVWHAVVRGHLPGRQDLTRRNLIRSVLLVGSGGAVFGAVEALSHAAGLPGARRRATGSHEQASHRPEEMPSIIWLFDPRPEITPADYRLTIVGTRDDRVLGYEDLRGHHQDVTAVIDCTVGWYAEQDWQGVMLDRLVAPPVTARSLLVQSQTGYSRRYPIQDLPRLLLATGYEGRPLAPRHGFPARLVAPGRRGFWWVKWVTRLEVSDVPWWWQPPYPAQ